MSLKARKKVKPEIIPNKGTMQLFPDLSGVWQSLNEYGVVSPLVPVPQLSQAITVATTGGDYTTVKAAIDDNYNVPAATRLHIKVIDNVTEVGTADVWDIPNFANSDVQVVVDIEPTADYRWQLTTINCGADILFRGVDPFTFTDKITQRSYAPLWFLDYLVVNIQTGSLGFKDIEFSPWNKETLTINLQDYGGLFVINADLAYGSGLKVIQAEAAAQSPWVSMKNAHWRGDFDLEGFVADSIELRYSHIETLTHPTAFVLNARDVIGCDFTTITNTTFSSAGTSNTQQGVLIA